MKSICGLSHSLRSSADRHRISFALDNAKIVSNQNAESRSFIQVDRLVVLTSRKKGGISNTNANLKHKHLKHKHLTQLRAW
jgi:hypothetical protein